MPANANASGSVPCSVFAVTAGDAAGRGIGVGQGVSVGLGVGRGMSVGKGVAFIVVSNQEAIFSADRMVSLCRTQLATVERVQSNSNSSEQMMLST